MNTLVDDPHNLFVSKVSGLCDDLVEEDAGDLRDQTDHLGQLSPKKRGRKKITVDKKNLRRSARLKKNKQCKLLFGTVKGLGILRSI